jgi:hypothetical protein
MPIDTFTATFGTLLLSSTLVGLDGLDAARAHVGAFLVLGMTDRSGSAVLPILGCLEGLHGFAHAVRDALSVLACVALGVMADKDGLTERDTDNQGRCSAVAARRFIPRIAAIFLASS